MSLLAPFYFFGAAAIVGPILFHLIRRQPKGKVPFSSLMFLQATPPRLTKRSRISNWLLLLLRAMALLLLALAFTRPFLRFTNTTEETVAGRRMIVMLDTSASMQRTGLWEKSLAEIDTILDDLQSADEIALVSFDDSATLQVAFDESRTLNLEDTKENLRNVVGSIGPTWRGTQLAAALEFCGELAMNVQVNDDRITDVEDNSERSEFQSDQFESVSARGATQPAQLILISDLQQGSSLSRLQNYAWPKRLKLDIRPVVTKDQTNASIKILTATDASGDEQERARIRVTNSGNSQGSTFSINWTETATAEVAESDDAVRAAVNGGVALQTKVAPGQSRVVSIPNPSGRFKGIELAGDQSSFDNRYYVVDPEVVEDQIFFFGSDTEEPRSSLFYYLEKLPLGAANRRVTKRKLKPGEIEGVASLKPSLLILSAAPAGELDAEIQDYLIAGGQLLAVLSDSREAEELLSFLSGLSDAKFTGQEVKSTDYAMLSGIRFKHPLFQKMAEPKFSDFTKIRFWKHHWVKSNLQSSSTIASFDDGSPAIIEHQLGDGAIYVLCSGWQPEASQLALSTKFLPLIDAFASRGRTRAPPLSLTVGDAVPFSVSASGVLTKPDGTEIEYRSEGDREVIDQPGIYQLVDAQKTVSFAVNLGDDESRVEVMPLDEFERFGALLGKTLDNETATRINRQMKDIELEKSQGLWHWLVVAALVLILTETFLSGRITNREPHRLSQLGKTV